MIYLIFNKLNNNICIVIYCYLLYNYFFQIKNVFTNNL